MPSCRETPMTVAPDSSHIVKTVARSSLEYRRHRSTRMMTSMRLIRTLLTECETTLLNRDGLDQWSDRRDMRQTGRLQLMS